MTLFDMQKSVFWLFLMIVGSICQAQSLDRFVIGTTGGQATSASYQLEFTAGESVVGTVETGTLILNQGFNQTNPPYNTAIEPAPIDVSYRLFPNPTTDWINVELIMSEAVGVTVSFTDLNGRSIPVAAQSWAPSTIVEGRWDLSGLPTGMYLMTVNTDSGELVKTFRINKRD